MSEMPRVWVGCLGCYNAGYLVGEWFDAADAPTGMDEFNGAAKIPEAAPGIEHDSEHEELWVMDHEGFAGLLAGECSPSTAREFAEVLEDVAEPEAFAIYVRDHLGVHLAPEDVRAAYGEFEDAWCGWWNSEAEYAQELAKDITEGLDDTASRWPFSCIDWDRAWSELRIGGENWSQYVKGCGYAIFRSV